MASENSSPGVVADMDLPMTQVQNTTKATLPLALSLARLLEPQYLLVIGSALGVIWLGAHGSLRRPPSAAPARVKKGEKKREEEKFMEGLVASDVIRFPLMLAAVLVGLYYLIQWLQDPAILNKILRGYMSIMSIAGLSGLTGDALEIIISLVFPAMWADSNGQVYHIDTDRRCQYVLDEATGEETVIQGKETPLPGRLSNLVRSATPRSLLWELRVLLAGEWAVRLNILDKAVFSVLDIRAVDPLRFVIAGLVAIAYHLTGWTALSNLLSLAMCYFSFMMFSPTSFTIGSMVLASLFVYDVVMVFYTYARLISTQTNKKTRES